MVHQLQMHGHINIFYAISEVLLFHPRFITVLYRTCLDMVADERSSLQSTHKDFEGGVHLGIGGFNLVRESTVNTNY